jgi:hypothetical protein
MRHPALRLGLALEQKLLARGENLGAVGPGLAASRSQARFFCGETRGTGCAPSVFFMRRRGCE